MGVTKLAASAVAASAAAATETAEERLARLINFTSCPAFQFAQHAGGGWRRPADPALDGFDLCPACFQASLAHTPHAALFVPAPPKPADVMFRCDFSLVWVRMAWIWILFRDIPDISLLARAAVVNTQDGECPNPQNDPDAAAVNRPTAVRTWFTVRHPATGRLMEEWTVCSHCAAAIETILPPFRDYKLLVPVAPEPCEASCDLVPGTDRMLQYVDKMVDFAARSIDAGRMADLGPLAKYIEDFASVPVCAKGNAVSRPGHVFQGLDLIVCEECYKTVVKPAADAGSELARSVGSAPAFAQNWTCQLYSPRVRQLWAECTSPSAPANAPAVFRQRAAERTAKEREVLARLRQLKMQFEQARAKAQYYQSMSSLQTIKQVHEQGNLLMLGYGPISSTSVSNQSQMSAGEETIRMGMIQDEINMLVRDWRDNWE
ncbi:hypothetical protein HK405_005347 [Cladochytrium tenue]|nr:hypothetical protein HK405_005347 [Cladochytrium tenue]